MSRKRLIGRPFMPALALALLCGACLSAVPDTQAAVETGSNEAASNCEAAPASAYTVSPQSPPSAAEVAIARPEVIKINEVLDIQGPCAERIAGYRMGAFAVRDGGAYAFSPGQGVIDWPNARGAVQPAQLPSDFKAPPLDGSFVEAVLANSRRTADGLEQHYVGLWRSAQGAVVADFMRQPDGSVSPATPLLRSDRAITGVTYLPSPDANTGRLSVVQAIAPGRARVTSYDTTF